MDDSINEAYTFFKENKNLYTDINLNSLNKLEKASILELNDYKNLDKDIFDVLDKICIYSLANELDDVFMIPFLHEKSVLFFNNCKKIVDCLYDNSCTNPLILKNVYLSKIEKCFGYLRTSIFSLKEYNNKDINLVVNQFSDCVGNYFVFDLTKYDLDKNIDLSYLIKLECAFAYEYSHRCVDNCCFNMDSWKIDNPTKALVMDYTRLLNVTDLNNVYFLFFKENLFNTVQKINALKDYIWDIEDTHQFIKDIEDINEIYNIYNSYVYLYNNISYSDIKKCKKM